MAVFRALRLLSSRAVFAGVAALVCALPLAYLAALAANVPGAALGDVAGAFMLSIALAAAAVALLSPIVLGFSLYTYQMASSTYRRWLSRPLHVIGGIPPVVYAAAVMLPALAVGGRPSAFWAVGALALALMPRACLMGAQSLRALPDRYYLSGISLGATQRSAIAGVVLRLSGPRLASCALICLAMALDQLALMQITLGLAPGLESAGLVPMPSLLLRSFKAGDLPTASATGVALLLTSAALCIVSRAFALKKREAEQNERPGKGAAGWQPIGFSLLRGAIRHAVCPGEAMKAGKTVYRAGALLALVLAIGLSLYAPALVVGFAASASWEGVFTSTVNSLLLAIPAGIVGTAAGTMLALILWEGMPRRMKRALLYVIFTLAGFPSIAIALVVAIALPGAAITTRLFVAVTLSVMPFAMRYMLEDLDTMPPYTVEAMHALGANGVRTIVDGVLPQSRFAILSTALYSCARALSEVAILSVLLTPRWSFLTYRIPTNPLSPTTFSSALVLCALAMLMFERAQALQARR